MNANRSSNRLALDVLIEQMLKLRDRLRRCPGDAALEQQMLFTRHVIARSLAMRRPGGR